MILVILTLIFISNIYDYAISSRDNSSFPILLKINKLSGKACRVENVGEFIFGSEKARCLEN